MTVAETLRMAAKLLSSNRYFAEADLCKEAADKADEQYRVGYANALQNAAKAVEEYKGTVVLAGIADEIRTLPLP